MKKAISLILSIVFLLSCFSTVSLASETENQEELTNIARVENALAYATSEKNTLWTPVVALNDGNYSKDTWQGWECGYPDIIYGSDTSKGFSGQYCGIKFTNSEYYEISSMYFNLGMHAAMGGQNAHYTVQCLVEGVWITVAEFSDSDAKPVGKNEDGSFVFSSYEDAMENDKSYYHIPAEIYITLDKPVTTNNVRVNLSEYGKNYPSGDVLIFPYIYEIELIGKRGVTPDLELPEGAVISTNIGYHSYPYASSSAPFKYPYCAIDGDITSAWSPLGKEAGEYLVLEMLSPQKINKVKVNFGEYLDGVTVVDYGFDIEALVNDEWVKIASGTAFDEENMTFITEYSFEEIETTAIKLVITESFSSRPSVYELEAHLSTEKTYYVEDRYNSDRKISASKGNIAIVGTAYADKDFVPYSDVNYINDGKISKDSYVWFTGVVDMPSYCGIKFNEKQLIDKVALYFYEPSEEGIDIMDIKIQALIEGEYVTVVDTKSYHKDLKYSPAFEFDAVETDDIRILYTRGNGAFANLKELEIYSPNGKVPMFDGLNQMADSPTFLKYPEDLNTPSEDENEPVIEPPCQMPSTDDNDSSEDNNDGPEDNNDCQPKDNDNILKIVLISVISAVVIVTVAVVLVILKRKKTK